MRSKDTLIVALRTVMLVALVSVALGVLAVSTSYGISSLFAPGLVPQITVGLSYPLFLLGFLYLATRSV